MRIPSITADGEWVPECNPIMRPSVVMMPDVSPKENPVLTESFIGYHKAFGFGETGRSYAPFIRYALCTYCSTMRWLLKKARSAQSLPHDVYEAIVVLIEIGQHGTVSLPARRTPP